MLKKAGSIFSILGIILFFGCFVFMILAEMFDLDTVVYGILSIILAIVFLGIGLFLINPLAEFKKRIPVYSSYVRNPNMDYALHINKMREKFHTLSLEEKEKLLRKVYKPNKKCDFGVLKGGQIYYAALVEVNNMAFRPIKTMGGDYSLPGVVLYSTDPYYDENPSLLNDIASYMFRNRKNNILKNELRRFYNFKIDETLTNGREVYMTCIDVFRGYLPLGYVTGSLLPIIADPNNSQTSFILDTEYWTKDLIADFIYGN